MKFIYADESGGRQEGDVFVMCGLMVDAYKLRKKTADFDAKLEAIFALHPGTRDDLKTKKFVNGGGAWKQVDAHERKDLLRGICRLAVSNGGKVYGYGMSFQRFDQAAAAGHGQPFPGYWVAAAMFVSALVQKKMQGVANSKGLTVVIMDDNKKGMPHMTGSLIEGHARCGRRLPELFPVRLQDANELLVVGPLAWVSLRLIGELQVAPVDPADRVGDLDQRRVIRLDRKGRVDDLVKAVLRRAVLPHLLLLLRHPVLVERVVPRTGAVQAIRKVRLGRSSSVPSAVL